MSASVVTLSEETVDQLAAGLAERLELDQTTVYRCLEDTLQDLSCKTAQINRRARIDHMSDRQNLIDEIQVRELGLDAYMLDRIDMYWINVDGGSWAGGATFYVETSISNGKVTWDLSGDNKHKELARQAFAGSEEEGNQEKWMKNLDAAGYFERGRWPGQNTSTCKHCKGTYKNDTAHEHTEYNGQIVAHSGKQYQKIRAAGLEVSWRPGASADEPSLEEQGKLKHHVIGS